MTSCSKCGGGAISGPSYSRDRWGRESLGYRCSRCGYIRYEPCQDAKDGGKGPFDFGEFRKSFHVDGLDKDMKNLQNDFSRVMKDFGEVMRNLKWPQR